MTRRSDKIAKKTLAKRDIAKTPRNAVPNPPAACAISNIRFFRTATPANSTSARCSCASENASAHRAPDGSA
jgi:hypothetical protein